MSLFLAMFFSIEAKPTANPAAIIDAAEIKGFIIISSNQN
jgi:hypothetical protein